jgi:hypothetical protein
MATGQRPQRHHAREVERRDRRHHPERVAVRDVVDPARHVARRLAHEQGGHPAGELHDLDAALTSPPASLASLPFSSVTMSRSSSKCSSRSALNRNRTGCRSTTGVADPAGEGRLGRLHGAVEVVIGRERGLGDDLAGAGIVDGLGLAAVGLLPATPDRGS